MSNTAATYKASAEDTFYCCDITFCNPGTPIQPAALTEQGSKVQYNRRREAVDFI